MRNDPDQLAVLTQTRQLFQSVLKRILVQCAETFIQKQCVYAGPVTRHARKTKSKRQTDQERFPARKIARGTDLVAAVTVNDIELQTVLRIRGKDEVIRKFLQLRIRPLNQSLKRQTLHERTVLLAVRRTDQVIQEFPFAAKFLLHGDLSGKPGETFPLLLVAFQKKSVFHSRRLRLPTLFIQSLERGRHRLNVRRKPYPVRRKKIPRGRYPFPRLLRTRFQRGGFQTELLQSLLRILLHFLRGGASVIRFLLLFIGKFISEKCTALDGKRGQSGFQIRKRFLLRQSFRFRSLQTLQPSLQFRLQACGFFRCGFFLFRQIFIFRKTPGKRIVKSVC